MDLSSLSVLAAILSIASSVRKLTEQFKISPQEAVDKFRIEAASSVEKDVLDDQANVEAVFATMTIDPKLLDQLQADALNCEKKHVDGLRNSKGIGARNTVDDQARQCMCGVLRQIRQFNKGKLVGNKLQNWWDSYGCVI